MNLLHFLSLYNSFKYGTNIHILQGETYSLLVNGKRPTFFYHFTNRFLIFKQPLTLAQPINYDVSILESTKMEGKKDTDQLLKCEAPGRSY